MNKLSGMSQRRLAQIWCLLNKWEWAEELGEPDPVPERDGDTPIRSGFMREIESMIPHSVISYVWNESRMSMQEHETWYRATFNNLEYIKPDEVIEEMEPQP